MHHTYDHAFFEWVDRTALVSARRMLPLVAEFASVKSVVDVGCGQGLWLSVWQRLGITDLHGLDGSYVDPARMHIAPDRFEAVDLAQPFRIERRFDLAQSLEVAEHLPPAVAQSFVRQLCALSDIVLFSAAQPGQGGENHINEKFPSYWAALFQAEGYAAFDTLRPALAAFADVAPWYRFNTLLFANAAGEARLAAAALATRCERLADLDRSGDIPWRIRRLVLRALPVRSVSWLSRRRYQMVRALGRSRQHASGIGDRWAPEDVLP